MSMFDDFLDESREIKCPKCGAIQQYFQTKDMDCTLDTYRISKDGILEELQVEIRDPKPEEQYEIAGIKLPFMIREYKGYAPLRYTGSINFYSPCDECMNWWFEYVCLVKQGKIIDMEDHSHENK